MKNLIILTVLVATFTGAAANASCTINLKKKKAGAKTSYTMSGETISKKVVAKLSSQCKFNYSIMSVSELRAMKIAKLKKQLAKLNK